MTYKILMILTLFGSTAIFAQSVPYTLQNCIDIALQNNFDLKSAQLRTETSEVNFKQNKNALLPSVNGNYNLGISRGRSIDPFTNDFVNEQLTFSNVGLGVNATIFNGFRLINGWKQAKLNLQASEMEIAEAKQTLMVNVTLSFLQVLSARDIVQLTETRIGSTSEQLSRLQSLFEEESGDPVEYRDLQGQIATDKVALITAQNDLKSNEINLNVLLNTDTPIIASNLEISIDLKNYKFTVDEILQEAFEHIPAIKARNLRLEAASKGVAVAKAQYVPEVSLFANLGTNYSSAARLFTETGSSTQETGDFVIVGNENLSVFTEQTSFSSDEISYGDQFENNVNSSFGIAVSVPVFNGFQAKNNVALEKIRKQEAQVAVDRSKLEVEQAITQSYNTMRAAYYRYQALEKQVDAFKESFRINEIRFENGVSTSVEYIASKNNLDNAQVSLTSVKYEYELRTRILNIYRMEFDF